MIHLTRNQPHQAEHHFSSTPSDSSDTRAKQLLIIGESRAWFQDVEDRLLQLRGAWTAQHSLDVSHAKAANLHLRHWDAVVAANKVGASDISVADLEALWPRVPKIHLNEELKPAEPSTVDTVTDQDLDPVDSADAMALTLLLQEWTTQPSTKNLLAQIKKLPTLPRLHLQVTQELQSPNGSLEVVSQFVRQDPVMSAKFLQVINSAGFGLAYAVTDPGEAVMFLGSVRTRALVLMAGVFSQFEESSCEGFSPEEIWRHSLLVARLAQGVALVQTEDPKLAEKAFTAGLMHDIGKLVMASNVPEMYSTAHKLQQFKRIQENEAEMAILSTSHAELGGALLARWHLPLGIVEAVGWHHAPGKSYDQNFSVLTAVHVANVLAHETDTPTSGVGRPPRFDMMYLVKLGLASRRNLWREGCGLPIREDEGTVEDTARRRLEAKHN